MKPHASKENTNTSKSVLLGVLIGLTITSLLLKKTSPTISVVLIFGVLLIGFGVYLLWVDKKYKELWSKLIVGTSSLFIFVMLFSVLLVYWTMPEGNANQNIGNQIGYDNGKLTGEDSERLTLVARWEYYNNLTVEDSGKMTKSYDAWVAEYNKAIKDGRLTSQEVAAMSTTINEYALEYRIVRSHLDGYMTFITSNEQKMKKYGVPEERLLKLKTGIQDTEIAYQNNIDRMKFSTEQLIASNKEQEENLLKIVKLLGSLLI